MKQHKKLVKSKINFLSTKPPFEIIKKKNRKLNKVFIYTNNTTRKMICLFKIHKWILVNCSNSGQKIVIDYHENHIKGKKIMPHSLKNLVETLINPDKNWKITLLYKWQDIIGGLHKKVQIEKIQG